MFRATEVTKSATYHHGDLKTALRKASLALIRDEGIEGLSLRAAARRAGVSPAAPYHHFSSRAALLADIAAEGFRLLHAEMETRSATLGPHASHSDRLTAAGESYVRFAIAHPAHFRVMFRPELADRTQFPELDACGKPVFGHLVSLVCAAQEAGACPAGDPMPYVLLCWSTVQGLASLLLDGPLATGAMEEIEVPPERMIEVVVGTLSAVLRAAAR